MICKNTLSIKNLPSELSDLEKKHFLNHFGAISVKLITSKCHKKCKAFAKFQTEEIAVNVMRRLHQMNILGSYLCVEYAESEIGCDKPEYQFIDTTDVNKHFKTFLCKLNAWNNSVAFNQPPPPHLKYLYPKPNRATINNIAHALVSVPKFYTQVLHLMNRMNLPPPFSNIPDPPDTPLPQTPTVPTQPESSSESEYESDPENNPHRVEEIIPEKRKKPQRKIIKKPKFFKPQPVINTVKNTKNTEEVFEKVNLQSQKKIELKVSENFEPKMEHNEQVEESCGIIPSQKENVTETKEIDNSEETEDTNMTISIITEEELAANRISPRDFGILPLFKDYHAGAPTCRLYIKNLSKNVTLEDLEHIYKRYELPSSNQQENMFDIRLLLEGRMKGQAFVTLQNVSQAQRAVKETNGFILKNKPLVVVFARSAVPKPKQ